MTGRMRRFDYFVVIAGMRTGSNLLEEILNDHPELTCHGELFNPHFIGKPNVEQAFGMTRRERNANPLQFLKAAMSGKDRLSGFRLFDEHNSQVLDHVLTDPKCGRIILTRNPAESYVSLKIARATRQWWLGDMKSQRSAKVKFEANEFSQFLGDVEAFRTHVRRTMLAEGLTAFPLRYDDLSDTEVRSGLFRFLGVDAAKRKLRPRTKVQNPLPLVAKVSNPNDMKSALARMDPFDLDRIPDFEPERGAGAPGVRVSEANRLMFLPVGSVAIETVDAWMSKLDASSPVSSGKTQRELKAWMREHPGHRAFSVVDHPLSRAFEIYKRTVIGTPENVDANLVKVLREDFGHSDGIQLGHGSNAALQGSFLGFLTFLRGTLDGQTGFRVRPEWASQISLLAGYAKLRMPDMIIRCGELSDVLSRMHRDVDPPKPPKPHPVLSEIYSQMIEKAARSAYRRDYAFLGFSDWADDQAA